MKLSSMIFLASVESTSTVNNRVARQAPDQDRRYFQLTDMMSFYNPSFDERKYWTYGCNCLILGKFSFFEIFVFWTRFH